MQKINSRKKDVFRVSDLLKKKKKKKEKQSITFLDK